MCKRFVSPH
ncbi:Protein CBG26487 [Caenorhabditis briggsae]|uniref:Protein CBG26487 n=1 Tax=Caenorhabditis briggsae TaxID=6238 RepID=B6IH38_CAEBR|nr:Protein CBG26487 [Caenorhabditis briggsae]CAR99218.1 Protein CBG26487 [Caenorhabditis briggsae]